MTEECICCSFISDVGSSWRWGNAISDEPRFTDHFRTGKTLGSGAYAVVKKCTSRSDKKSVYAVKICNTKQLSTEEKEALDDEISVLQSLNHAHILRLFYTYHEKNYIYLVTELIAGGELFERVVKKGNYTEKAARDTCKILFEAIGHCHDHNVVHRDLKPENLLLMSLDNDSELKIADFGFAKLADGDSLTTRCGTPGYIAPEIVRCRSYGSKVDMWSLGCITYGLLCGYLPFHHDDLKTLFKMILSGKYSFDDDIWAQVSDDAKDLVSNLLVLDPSKRFSAKDALNHRWLLEDDDKLKSRSLDKTLKKLAQFNAKRKFRAAVGAVMTADRLSQLIKTESNVSLGTTRSIDNIKKVE